MFMRRGAPPLQHQNSAERALARANQRLHSATAPGARQVADQSDDEEDLNAYLSSLRKKTQGDPGPARRSVQLPSDVSDISLTDSSEARVPKAAAKSKFLKSRPRAAPKAAEAPPATRLGTAVGSSALQRSAALAAASRLAGKYSQPTLSGGPARARKGRRPVSDSDLSGPSTDTSGEAKLKAEPALSETLYAKSSRAKLGYLTDEESASIGKDGGKFLKKAAAPAPKGKKQLRFAGLDDEPPPRVDEEPKTRGHSPGSPKSPGSSRSDRLRRSPAITESDEDFSTAELGEGLLSVSSAPPLTPESPKRPSLRSPDTPRSPKKRVTIAEAVVARTPSPEEPAEELSELSFVPEQFGPASDRSSSPESAGPVSDTGRAETIMDAADFLDSDSDDSSSPRLLGDIRSIEELSTASSEHERTLTSSSTSSSTSSTVIHSEQQVVTEQYSDSDFESVSEATRPTSTAQVDSYAPDFESSSSQERSSSQFEEASSSEETTVTESFTARIRRRRRRSARDSDKSVQTLEAGMEFRWDLRHGGVPVLAPGVGMTGLDLSPIAHFAVAPEALEAVTAYSPSVIALNNMLRQQLDLTRSFVSTQRRLYDAMARTIAPDFSYTTLEGTKEFIRKNRPKSLTMEEALREVEMEL